MSFLTGTQAELLYTLPSTVTKNTYTTEAVMSAVAGTTEPCSLDPHFFRSVPKPVGRSLKLEAWGTIGATGTPTLGVNLGFDSSIGVKANPITVFAATTIGTTTAVWSLEAWYTCTAYASGTSTSCTLQVNGRWSQEITASGAALASSAVSSSFQGTVQFDPRVEQYIELFGTWSLSNVANTTSLQQMFLWGAN